MAAENHQSGQGGLLKDADLKLALAKRAEKKPNLAWGMRYHPAYERTMSFLDFSKKSDEDDIANRKRLAERRKKVFRAIFAFICVIMVGALIASYFAYEAQQEATKSAGKAQAQEKKALASANEARIAGTKAVKSAEEAREAQKVAVKSAERAENERKNALTSATLARAAESRAQKDRILAEKQTEEAIRAKGIAVTKTKEAEESANVATKATKVAVTAKKEADNLSKLVIAQKMGLRSIQLTNPIEQALVAQQAYKIFKKASAHGNTQDPNIYDGLYYAIKMLSDPHYNQFRGHFSTIRAMIPAYGKYVYSTGSDGTIRKCDLNVNLTKGADIAPLVNTNEVNRSLSLSPGAKVMASGGNSQTIRLYSVDGAGNVAMKSKINTGQSEILKVVMAGNTQLYALSSSGEVTYWQQSGSKWKNEVISQEKSTLMTANSQKIAWNKGAGMLVYNNRVAEKLMSYRLTAVTE